MTDQEFEMEKIKICLIGRGAILQQCANYLFEKENIEISILNPMEDQVSWAIQNKVKVFENFNAFISSKEKVDFLFSINNPIYLPSRVINSPDMVAINYHNSLLPAYAGVNATSWAILNGESLHGVT